MNLEQEVFKIGKQLEKIVGEEGTVSYICCYFDRPVMQISIEPIHRRTDEVQKRCGNGPFLFEKIYIYIILI